MKVCLDLSLILLWIHVQSVWELLHPSWQGVPSSHFQYTFRWNWPTIQRIHDKRISDSVSYGIGSYFCCGFSNATKSVIVHNFPWLNSASASRALSWEEWLYYCWWLELALRLQMNLDLLAIDWMVQWLIHLWSWKVRMYQVVVTEAETVLQLVQAEL